MPDVIVPYVDATGVTRQLHVSEAAQEAAKHAQSWSEADSAFTAALTRASARGVNNLDPTSQNNKNEAERRLRSNRPKPATIVNLHPWPLTFGSGNRFLRGITVPACNPGDLYAYVHVRKTALDWEYDEDGSLDFNPVLPINLAAEFLREFGNKDAYGGGVLIYEGEAHPDKVGDVETYDPLGRPLTDRRPGIENDGEQDVAVLLDIAIKKPFLELLQDARKRRNAHYLDRVRKADHDYKRPDGRGKYLLNDTHLKMAEMLHAEGLIPVLPEWNLPSRLEAGLADENCPACGKPRAQDAFKCGCGHILDAFEAYQAGAIEWGHASMETMSMEELEMAEKIRVARSEKTTILRRNISQSKAAVEERDEEALSDPATENVPTAD